MSVRVRGYAGQQSVAQGGRLELFFSNLVGPDLGQRPVRIVRQGLHPAEVARGVAEIRAQPIPAPGWLDNRWRASLTLEAGEDWPSGVYTAQVDEAGEDAPPVYFIVRPGPRTAKAAMVVQIPTTTMNAYNNWGGASLYGYNSTPRAATAVSFDRPQQSDAAWPRGYGFESEWTLRIKAFIEWLELAGYVADVVADNDLHEDAGLLDGYRLFVSIGHDEYWSSAMRAGFDRFVGAGGNAAILGGNTGYWRIRLEAEDAASRPHRLQVCGRTREGDPLADAATATVTWREAGLPENLSFGAGFAEGAGAWRGAAAPGAFTVWRPDHWVFQGTGLARGDRFGDGPEEVLLGYETNGVVWRLDAAGLPVPTGEDGTPAGYEILALAELDHWQTPGNAAMGVFAPAPGAGLVFNAATTDWAKGLEAAVAAGEALRTTTAKITANVLDRFLERRPYRLQWLPEVLRRAGLRVVTHPGWETRGRGNIGVVRGVMCHHTAGPPEGNLPSLGLVVEGRPDLAGPLSHLCLARDGAFHVVAAGRANHAGAGEWRGIATGNTSFIGIEAENSGQPDDPWPEVQMDAYRRGVAALLAEIGADASMCCGHKEYALPPGRKIDPTFDMDDFRAAVAAILEAGRRTP